MDEVIQRLLKRFSEQPLEDRYRFLGDQPIGSGGAGIVFKVNQERLDIVRALKVSFPEQGKDIDSFLISFETEVFNLSKLSHTNVVKIQDSGTLPEEFDSRPYFVMEYADGLLQDVIVDQNREDFLGILRQLFDGLTYIHDNKGFHGDLKPSNILYQKLDTDTGSRIEVKFADLGTSKFLEFGDGTNGHEHGETTKIYVTRKYAAPELRIKGKDAEVDWLQENKEVLDLYSLGVTLTEFFSGREMLVSPSNSSVAAALNDFTPKLKRILTDDEQEYLKRVILKLTNDNVAERYQNVREAAGVIRRLDPRNVAFDVIPELTGVGCTREIVHGGRSIKFSVPNFRWLNHPAVQRLHNVNQLGFLFHVYPGAKHSRFAHSLDVFATARELVLNLLNDKNFRFIVSEQDISLFLAASLLHDIGHYPLAHLLEDLIPEVAFQEVAEKVFNSDSGMVAYFLNKKFETDARVKSYKDEPLATLLENSNINTVHLIQLVTDAPPENLSPAHSILRQLLNGPLDVDKIAYLRHDSSATSVSYGSGIDTDGLFTSLAIQLPRDLSATGVPRLVLRERGVSAAESVILARYHMYSRVYWHRANRAIMAMLKYAVSKLLANDPNFVQKYILKTHSLSDWQTAQWLSQEMRDVTGSEDQQSKRPIGNSLPGLVDGTRRIHREILRLDRSLNERTEQQVRLTLLDIVSDVVHLSDLTDDDVLLDSPRRNKTTIGDIAVLREYGNSDSETLQQRSDVTKAVVQQFRDLGSTRIFLSRKVWDECVNTQRIEEVRRAIARRIGS